MNNATNATNNMTAAEIAEEAIWAEWGAEMTAIENADYEDFESELEW